MRYIRPLLLALLAASVGGAARAQPLERGETLVRRHCGGCHAISAKGASREPAAPAFRDLHRRYDPELLSEALGEGLLVGHPMMPQFRFEPDDVEAIVLYLKSLQPRQPA